MSEPMPKERQRSGSTRGSLPVSSHQTRRPLRTHSPERPCLVSRGAPNGGAGSPVRTRQVIWSPVKNARAAPLDSVRLRAQSAMNWRTAATSFPRSRTLRRTVSIAASVRFQPRWRQPRWIQATATARALLLSLSFPRSLLGSFPVTRELPGSGLTVRASDQQVVEKPFLQNFLGIFGERREADPATARVIAPDDLATAMDVAFRFRQIEAERDGPIHFQALAGLDGEPMFVEVEQFAQIHNHPSLRAVKAGVHRSVKFLANRETPLSLRKSGNWIRQSANAPIHLGLILTRERRQGAR